MKLIVDTNVIIRLLTGDDIEQSPKAKQLFQLIDEKHGHFVVSPIVVSECVYVLRNGYGYERKQIAEALQQLFDIECMELESPETVKTALRTFSEQNVDIADALIAGFAKERGFPVVTWNSKHFKKLYCEFYTPDQMIASFRSNEP